MTGYRIGRFLGGGGFSFVFAAIRDQDAKQVALKIARSIADERMHREAELLDRLGAQRIAPLLVDAGECDGTAFIAMELVSGHNLCTWLARDHSADEVTRMLRAVARSVDVMHAAGVVHRDLKPENIILRSDRATLLDFGLARRIGDTPDNANSDPRLTRTAQRLGTAVYMAPEQCSADERIDASADVYALGVIAFEGFAGRPPFAGDTTEIHRAHVAFRPPLLSRIAGSPTQLDAVMEQALAKVRDHRFASGGALVDAICSAAAERPVRARTVTSPGASISELAMMAVPADIGVHAVESALADEGGLLARVTEHVVIAAFIDTAAMAGVRAALRVAERGDWRGVVIHVAPLRARTAAGRTTVRGTALTRTEQWLSDAPPDQATVLTPAAASVLCDDIVRPLDGGRFFVRDPGTVEVMASSPALVGRDDLIRELSAEAAGCFADSVPTLSTIIGDSGHGKTRLLEELACRVGAGHDVEVLSFRAALPARSDRGAVLASLTRASLGLERPGATVDDVRSAVSALCDRDPSTAEWASIALTLGLLDATDAAVAEVLRAPGALRATTARLVGLGLRRRAARAPLAVFVDDVDLCDLVALDALEIAAMSTGTPLYLCVTARPELLDARPAWGDRPLRDRRFDLAPLDHAASRALLTELLLPVEYVAEDVLAKLLDAAKNIPAQLVDLVHALRVGGGIRRLPGTESWAVSLDDDLLNPSTPLSGRLVKRIVGALPASLHRFVELCAVIGEPLIAAEIAEVQRQLERESDEDMIDSEIGLERLARLQVVVRADDDRYRFRQPMLEQAIEAQIDAATRHALHAAALRRLEGAIHDGKTSPRRIARHAARSGAPRRAAEALLESADRAARIHNYSEAERCYGAALGHLGPEDAVARRRCLGGRGRMRYRLWHLAAARADLDEAIELAGEHGESRAVVELLLEQATILDWSYDFAASADLAERAGALARGLDDPHLAARCLFAEGRTAYRRELLDRAIVILRRAAARAKELCDYELRCVALLLIGPALVFAGELDEAVEPFATVVAECEEAGDRFHLAAALVNRMTLWMKRGDFERAETDARRAVEVARELGNAQIERGAAYNLAELLGWLGRLDEAIAMGERSRELQLRYCEVKEPEISILCARLRSIRGEHDQAARLVDWIDASCDLAALAPSQTVLLSMVRLRCGDPKASWTQTLAAAREQSLLDEHLEVLLAHVDHAVSAGLTDTAAASLAEVDELEPVAPHWRARFAQFRAT